MLLISGHGHVQPLRVQRWGSLSPAALSTVLA